MKKLIIIIVFIQSLLLIIYLNFYSMKDVCNIYNYVLGYKSLNTLEKIKYDYDKNGEVELFDAVLILNNENIKDTNNANCYFEINRKKENL